MRILVVGDAMIPAESFCSACDLFRGNDLSVHATVWIDSDKAQLQRQRIQVEKEGPGAVPVPEEVKVLSGSSEFLLVHYCPVSQELIEAAPFLRLIGVARGGVENIDVDVATRHGIPVLNVNGRNAEAVSDFTVGLMLAEMRNMVRSHQALLAGRWRKDFVNSPTELRGKRIGLVGLGKIGSQVAHKLSGFRVHLLGYDPYLSPEYFQRLGVENVGLDTLLSTSDIISLHARLTDTNRGLIGLAEIGRMKKTAILVNTARAGLVDEEALVMALRDKRIGGAALDVFSLEPLPLDHPLLHLDNVTLTSHLGGTTLEALTRSPVLLCENIWAFMKEGCKENLINPAVLDHPRVSTWMKSFNLDRY